MTWDEQRWRDLEAARFAVWKFKDRFVLDRRLHWKVGFQAGILSNSCLSASFPSLLAATMV